jgi:hypothetical protein
MLRSVINCCFEGSNDKKKEGEIFGGELNWQNDPSMVNDLTDLFTFNQNLGMKKPEIEEISHVLISCRLRNTNKPHLNWRTFSCSL